MSQYHITQTNPNEDTGGGGTICAGDARSEDCKPPYVVFPHSSTDSNISPHVVLCSACLTEVANGLADQLEEVIDAEVVEESEVPVV